MFGGPEMVDFHETEFRRMTVVSDVIIVLGVALNVHLPGVPIALLGHALRRPMRPDAELRVAEPFGALVILRERFPGRFEFAVGDFVNRWRDGGFGGVA